MALTEEEELEMLELEEQEASSAPKDIPWSEVPGNALKDIKTGIQGFADPLKLAESATDLMKGKSLGETATAQKIGGEIEQLKNPVDTAIQMGKGAIEPFIHPIESFKKNPVNTIVGAAMMGEKAPSPVKKAPTAFDNFLKEAGGNVESSATASTLGLNTFGIQKMAKGKVNPETIILDMNKKINQHMPDLVNTFDTPSSKFQKVLDANKNASDAIGQVIDSTTQKTGKNIPEIQEAIDELKAAAESPQFKSASSARNIEARSELLDAARYLEALKDSGDMSFRNLYEVKKGVGEAYNNPNFDNAGIDTAYSILSQKIDKVLDRATVEDVALKDQFARAKEVFKLTDTLIPAMKKGVSRDVASGGGILDKGLAVAALFDPITAVGAYLGKTGAQTLFPDVMKNLIYKGVQGAKKLPSVPIPGNIDQSVAAYLASQFANKRQNEQ